MRNLLNSIRQSIEQKNWYSALVVSLILPDICGKIEGENISSKRYSEWFEKYLGKKYKTNLSGLDCYSLRCSFLHEGTNNIEHQNKRDILDTIMFIPNGSHLTRLTKCHFGDPKYDGKDILQLSVKTFCEDIVAGVELWINNNPTLNIGTNMLEIHESGIHIGGIQIK